jgi:hypothetical protein
MKCYKGHKSSSEGIQRDLNQQENNQTSRKFLKSLEEEEAGKYNPNMG